MAALLDAKAKGFELACPFPSWPHRGLPVFDGGKLFWETPSLDSSLLVKAAAFLRPNFNRSYRYLGQDLRTMITRFWIIIIEPYIPACMYFI